MLRSLLCAGLVLALLPGCFISRRDLRAPLDPEKVASLRPGVHTASDVVQVMGAPTEVVQLGKRSAYLYDAVTEKQAALFLVIFSLRGLDQRSDRVWTFFDEEGLLTHVGATLEARDSDYEMPLLGEDD